MRVQDYIFSRIVDKVSDKFFLQAWAHEVAEIAQAHIARINAMLDYDESGELYAEFDKTSAESAAYQKRSEALRSQFDKFLDGLHHNINGSIARQQAVEMLSQHIITAPIFDALFGNTDFTRYNPISRSMEEMLFAIRQNGLDRVDEATAAKLKGFYDNIKDHISHLDNAHAKQKVIVKLYDNFFKIAFPKMAKTMGIVYTPVEVVDFIIHSVNAVLKRDFGRSLSDEGVNIIDPFTGTGTFITRLLQSGIIGAADMERKYIAELFANEIVLLAYYIAAANIESAYASVAGSGQWVVGSTDGIEEENTTH